MRHDAADKEHPPHEVHLRDEPVLVASDVEDDVRSHKIRRVERLFHLRETGPGRPFGDSIPVVHGAASMRMLLAEGPNCLVADNVHPGPISWSHNGTALSMIAFLTRRRTTEGVTSTGWRHFRILE